MKKFVNIFHLCLSESHIDKEAVQIPYFFAKKFSFSSEVYYTDVKSEEYKGSKPVGGNYNGILPIFKLKNRKILFFNLEILKKLIKDSKNIDVLMLIHFIKPNILYGYLYKFLNPKGKLYIKMDFDPYQHNINTYLKTKYNFINKIIFNIVNLFIKKCTCISVETKEGYSFLLKYNKSFKDKLVYMPNGIDAYKLDSLVEKKSFQQKENIILTVGRIGTYQKNTNLLLDSFKKIDLKDRKVYIVGPIEADYKRIIKEFFLENPHLKKKIFFRGPIYNKKELYEIYNKSKIFCLTSRYESFGIVLIEAMNFGNYIVSTNVSSIKDIIDNGKYGTIIPSYNSSILSEKIKFLINNEKIIRNNYKNSIKYSQNNFNWYNIINTISEKIL